MAVIHQFLPLLAPGDGMGNAARAIAARLTELGIDNDFFVAVDPQGIGLPYSDFTRYARPDSIALYHLGTASPIADFLRERHESLALYYQNITPPEYFASMDGSAAYVQNQARRQLRALCDRTTVALAPSKYNADELTSVGYRDVAVAPILFDVDNFAATPEPAVIRMLDKLHDSEGFSNWLYVGRLVPSKAQEVLIMALDAHRDAFGDTAVLHLVGRPGYRTYLEALRNLVTERKLERRVNFVLGATPNELAAFYRGSGVFISSSFHEGFGMPLVEALAHGLPIIAYGAAAVPETVGSGGIILKEQDPLTIATAANLVASDVDVQRTLVAGGLAQLRKLSPSRTVPIFDAALAHLLETCQIDPGDAKFGSSSTLATRFEELLEKLEYDREGGVAH